ncbi:MAG: spore cortex biosynthesis protein YabQ [Roseburia sp.]|nr:spore cortex biosynthesis protein YabQ [Roseburia sp.]
MQVSEAIGSEAIFFLVSALCGMGLVLTYDLFRIFRRLLTHGNIWIGIEDACYWIFCTVAVFLLLYQKNDGMMRAFTFVGILLGGALYHFVFSRFVIKICVLVLGTILKFVRKILGTLLSPFSKTGRKILTFLGKQLKKLYKAIKMGLCKL